MPISAPFGLASQRGIDFALFKQTDISPQSGQAMRMDTATIGGHEHVSGYSRIGGAKPVVLEYGGREFLELFGSKSHL